MFSASEEIAKCEAQVLKHEQDYPDLTKLVPEAYAAGYYKSYFMLMAHKLESALKRVQELESDNNNLSEQVDILNKECLGHESRA